MQKRSHEPSVDLEEIILEPRTSKTAKPYSYNQQQRNTSPPGACTAHLSPCCQSPSLRPHPKSTTSTACPAPSPAVTASHSPAISPAPTQMLNGVESQDKRGEIQPPQDYPESLEPGKRKQNRPYINNNIVVYLKVFQLPFMHYMQLHKYRGRPIKIHAVLISVRCR